jgi:hypothetical protein
MQVDYLANSAGTLHNVGQNQGHSRSLAGGANKWALA